MARTNGNIYRDYRKGKAKRKRSFSLSLLLFILDIVMVGVLFLLSAATIICVVTPSSAPERLGIFSVVVLGAPIIYMLTLLTTLYWALRWRWSLAFMSFIFLFIGTLSVGKYYRLDLKQGAESKFPSNTIKVMSYNIANSNATSLVDTIALHRPTILCVQEYKSVLRMFGSALVQSIQLQQRARATSRARYLPISAYSSKAKLTLCHALMLFGLIFWWIKILYAWLISICSQQLSRLRI